MSKKTSISFGLGLFAGVVGGILAGILYAPKPGEESRNELKETVTELAKKHSPEVKMRKSKQWNQLIWLNIN